MRPTRTYQHRLHAILAAVVAAAHATAAHAQSANGLLPRGASTSVAAVDQLFWSIVAITTVSFVLVVLALLWLVVRYRERPGRRAVYSHGNVRLEIVWTLIPTAILAALALVSGQVWTELKGAPPEDNPRFEVEIAPRQFQWDVRYPGVDGQFGTDDDITTINQVRVPLGHTIVVRLRSQDVIHSFFVPALRIKQDAVPGMLNQLWFVPTRAGKFEIACAELCGLAHYRMRGYLTIEDPGSVQQWIEERSAPRSADAPTAADSTERTEQEGR